MVGDVWLGDLAIWLCIRVWLAAVVKCYLRSGLVILGDCDCELCCFVLWYLSCCACTLDGLMF